MHNQNHLDAKSVLPCCNWQQQHYHLTISGSFTPGSFPCLLVFCQRAQSAPTVAVAYSSVGLALSPGLSILSL